MHGNNDNNRVRLTGNLGFDPEVRETAKGRKVARLSVATNESYKNASGERVTDTQWHTVVAWGQTAEMAERLLRKGTAVAVEGRLAHRSYEGGGGRRIYVTEVAMSGFRLLPERADRPDEPGPLTVDGLANEIRRVDGSNSLGAGALAEAVMPYISARREADLRSMRERVSAMQEAGDAMAKQMGFWADYLGETDNARGEGMVTNTIAAWNAARVAPSTMNARTKTIKVALLEDDVDRVAQFRDRLRESGVGHELLHFERADDLIAAMRMARYDLILLDHDLGGRARHGLPDATEDCGMRVAEWFAADPDRPRRQGPVVIHSLNEPAARRMAGLIAGSVMVPFAWTKGQWS